MKKTIVYLAAAVFLTVLVSGCAGALNEKFGPWPTYTKPIDGFEVYQLNSSYCLLVWNKNRTTGICTCTESHSAYKHKVSGDRCIHSWRTEGMWKIGYCMSETSDVLQYETEAKKAVPLTLTLQRSTQNGKEVFNWSELPAALCSHVDGLYIDIDIYNNNRRSSLSSNSIEISDFSTREYQTDAVSGNAWYLYVKVDGDYYPIGTFRKI